MKKKKSKNDPGLGFSVYRATVSMSRTASTRAKNRAARKKAKRDARGEA